MDEGTRWTPPSPEGQIHYQRTYDRDYYDKQYRNANRRQTRDSCRVFGIFGALAAIGGSLLPWASYSDGWTNYTANGWDVADGKLVAALGLGVLVVLVAAGRNVIAWGVTALICGVGVAAVGYLNVASVQDMRERVTVDGGLWLTVIGGAVMGLAGIIGLCNQDQQ